MKWDTRVENFDRIDIPPSSKQNTIELGNFGHMKIQKLSLHILGEDIDIRMIKNGRDMGTNTQFLDKYGMYTPNGDWHLVNVGAQVEEGSALLDANTFANTLSDQEPALTTADLLSDEDTARPYYNVSFIPYEFEIDDLTIELRNNDEIPGKLVDGKLVYMLPMEEGD